MVQVALQFAVRRLSLPEGNRGETMRLVGLTLAAFTLSGCATFFNATMEADPTAVGPEGIILINELRRAYDFSDTTCDPKSLPSFQEEGLYSYNRYHDYPSADDEKAGKKAQEAYEKFGCWRFKDSDKPGSDAEKIAALRHAKAGFALSDYYCDTFFRRIARRTSERRFGRSATNDVGAAISAVLGFAKAGSNIVGGVATGFGLADGVIRAYDEIFTISPDLGNIQSLVKDKHKSLWADLATKPPVD